MASANNKDACDVHIDKEKDIRAKVAKRFKFVTDKTIEKDINSIEPLYRKWFWQIYCKFCLTDVHHLCLIISSRKGGYLFAALKPANIIVLTLKEPSFKVISVEITHQGADLR